MNDKIINLVMVVTMLCISFYLGLLFSEHPLFKNNANISGLSVSVEDDPTFLFNGISTFIRIKGDYELGSVTPTGSMYPIIQDDSYPVERMEWNNTELLNKIVVYKRGEDRIIHRCVELRNDGCVMLGDNNGGDDGLIMFEDIVSVVDYVLTPV